MTKTVKNPAVKTPAYEQKYVLRGSPGITKPMLLRMLKTRDVDHKPLALRAARPYMLDAELAAQWDEISVLTPADTAAYSANPALLRTMFWAIRPAVFFKKAIEDKRLDYLDEATAYVAGRPRKYTSWRCQQGLLGEEVMANVLSFTDTTTGAEHWVLGDIWRTAPIDLLCSLIPGLRYSNYAWYRQGDVLLTAENEKAPVEDRSREHYLPIVADDQPADNSYQERMLSAKHKFSLNVNPGTLRHTLTSDAPITHVVATANPHDTAFRVRLAGPTVLVHPEHGDLRLNAGMFTVSVMQEYDPWQEMFRPVFD